MKKIFLVSCLLALAACMLCGCDMFRSLAGRPTSGDLAEMRAELARREAVETARRDSVERVVRHQQDSIAAAQKALETLAGMGGLLREPSQLSGLSSSTSLGSRYYAVLGSICLCCFRAITALGCDGKASSPFGCCAFSTMWWLYWFIRAVMVLVQAIGSMPCSFPGRAIGSFLPIFGR